MKKEAKKSREAAMEEICGRNVVEIISTPHVRELLESKKNIRVKFGIDPTAKNIHIGHLAILQKLKQFQVLGHKIVLIIGDFTGMIGDPSGKSKTRTRLTQKEINENMKSYIPQIGKILDIKKCEARYNSEWYAKKDLSFFSDILSGATVQQVLERDDFQKRIKEHENISILEAIYPLLQGYDSVAVRSDVEIGGTDQKFNILMGRKMQRHFGLPEQDIITLSLLVGTDGERKMSKSFGNVINVTDAPNDMFGKIMSISDLLIFPYYQMVTTLSEDEIKRKEREQKKGSYPYVEAKKDLAFLLVESLYSSERAKKARTYFEDTFQKRKVSPEDLARVTLSSIADISSLPEYGFSKSELRRLIGQRAVEFDGKVVESINFIFLKKGVLRIGKRIFLEILPKK